MSNMKIELHPEDMRRAAAFLAHVATNDAVGDTEIVSEAKAADRLDLMLYGVAQLFFDGNPNLYRSEECIQVWREVANNYASYDDGTTEGEQR
jgi:DNA polymerase III delta prime subunit